MTEATADTLRELEPAFAGIDTEDGASLSAFLRAEFDAQDFCVLGLPEVEALGRRILALNEIVRQNALVG